MQWWSIEEKCHGKALVILSVGKMVKFSVDEYVGHACIKIIGDSCTEFYKIHHLVGTIYKVLHIKKLHTILIQYNSFGSGLSSD